MAVRTPLYYVSGNLREMDSSMISNIIDLTVYEYSLNPSVTLSVSGSGGNLTSINDTRLQAGAYSTNVSSFPSEATTSEPSIVTVAYQRITKTNTSVTPTSDTGKTFPLYYTSGGNLQHMSVTDFRDTFIHPAIDKLILGTTTTLQGGTYFVSTSTSVSGSTLVSATPIFVDTIANTSLYTSTGIPETLDQPTTITSYYLHRINGSSITLTQVPIYADASNNIKQFSQVQISNLLAEYIRQSASASSLGYRITYDIGATGNTRGSALLNTQLTGGSGNYQTFQAGIDDYRAQEFPDGTPNTVNTYTFRINKI